LKQYGKEEMNKNKERCREKRTNGGNFQHANKICCL